MRKVFSVIAPLFVVMVCCMFFTGCDGIKRMEEKEGVLYRDKRTKDIVYYWDQGKDGSLQKMTVITGRDYSLWSNPARASKKENEIIFTDEADYDEFLPVDSSRARKLQDAYNEIRESFAATKNKTYPENQVQSRPEAVGQFESWLQEYHSNVSTPSSNAVQEFHSYLSFLAMRYWYNQLNWLEKLSVFENPEAAGIIGLEFMRKGSIGISLRDQFEDGVRLLSEDMRIMADRLQQYSGFLPDGNTEYYNYKESCKSRGLSLDSFN